MSILDGLKINERGVLDVSKLKGHFFYSKKQFSHMRREKPARKMYCYILNGENFGKIKEYTELITDEMRVEDPTITCLFDDAVYLGYGYFFDWGDMV